MCFFETNSYFYLLKDIMSMESLLRLGFDSVSKFVEDVAAENGIDLEWNASSRSK